MKNILFVAYGGGHINIIDLVASKLLKDKSISFNILALTSAYDKVIDKYPKGVVKSISDYKHLFENSFEKIEEYGKKIYVDMGAITKRQKEDLIFYLGISMLELVETYGTEKADILYKEKKRQAFLPIKVMKNILQYHKTDIVVSTTSPRFEQASFIAGNKLGITTVEILDLFGDLYPLPEAKHIICMNKAVENTLKENGVIDKRYYHYGQPVIEKSVKDIINIDVKNLKKKLNLSRDTIVMVYASQVPVVHKKDCSYHKTIDYKNINNKIFSLLDNLCDKYNIQVYFRIHPNEKMKEYEKYFRNFKRIQYSNEILSFSETLAISDMLITPYSTVAIESVAAGNRTFTYKSDFDVCYPVKEMTQVPFIFSNNFSELENNLNLYLSKAEKKSSKINSYFLPKNSLDKIIKLIKDL